MAMRSVVGKLKALSLRMPRFGPVPPKDMLGYQRLDVTKYDSVGELSEALRALREKEFKANREAYERYWKAQDRILYVTVGAGFAGTISFVLWLVNPASS